MLLPLRSLIDVSFYLVPGSVVDSGPAVADTVSVTLPVTPQLNDLIWVAARGGDKTLPASISDTNTNTWQGPVSDLQIADGTGASRRVDVWYCTAKAGGTTISVTYTGGAAAAVNQQMQAGIFRGNATSSVQDATGTGDSAGSTGSTSSVSIASLTDGDIILVAATTNPAFSSATPSSGYVNMAANSRLATAYRYQRTHGADTPGFTWNTALEWAQVAVAFKANVTFNLSVSGSGGAIAGGAGTVQFSFFFAGAGGAVTSGATAQKNKFLFSGAGGAITSGTGTVKESFRFAGAGSAITGGIAPLKVNFKVSGTGGAITAGSAPQKNTFKVPGGGGALAGGVAPWKLGIRFAMSGATVTGGAGRVKSGFSFSGTGSAFTNGSDVPKFAFRYTGVSGAFLGGISTVRASFAFPGAGGAVSGGLAAIKTGSRFSGTGGAAILGSGNPRHGFTFPAAGTLGTGGAALVHITLSGLVHIRATSFHPSLTAKVADNAGKAPGVASVGPGTTGKVFPTVKVTSMTARPTVTETLE